MKIGIFGGTFDPVHNGHLHLASEVLERRGLDQIWFVPVRISPHKLDSPPTDVKHRIAMLQLALEPYPNMQVCEVEAHREGPSYTVDTIHDLKQQYPDHQFYLVMSDEVLPNFTRWHQPERIAKEVPFIVASRLHQEPPDLQLPDPVAEAVRQGWTPTKIVEVSATKIRERIQKNLNCSGYLPQKVLDYIKANHLYYNN